MAKTLSAFLKGNSGSTEQIVTYAPSARFKDPDTDAPALWEIKTIPAKENMQLRKQCIHNTPLPGGRKGQFTQQLDANEYQVKVAVQCTAWPDLNDKALQDSYKVMGAEDLLLTMLTPGEFEDYSDKVFEVNGFESAEELVDDAKN